MHILGTWSAKETKVNNSFEISQRRKEIGSLIDLKSPPEEGLVQQCFSLGTLEKWSDDLYKLLPNEERPKNEGFTIKILLL